MWMLGQRRKRWPGIRTAPGLMSGSDKDEVRIGMNWCASLRVALQAAGAPCVVLEQAALSWARCHAAGLPGPRAIQSHCVPVVGHHFPYSPTPRQISRPKQARENEKLIPLIKMSSLFHSIIHVIAIWLFTADCVLQCDHRPPRIERQEARAWDKPLQRWNMLV